ncbi:MAG: amidohydrolase [Chloroflexi bacterium]|nr:amidohydrolase [Chloroflexota bacterium]MBV9133178.1 amidohydrolase [Chloroflexota bacterium]MBV9898499.1 amidohydrolase [Chloroflexota bacterium]
MRAIDVHVHPTDERIARAWAGDIEDAERFFRGPWTHEDLDATASRYAGLDTLAVLLGADAETTTGVPAYPNDELAAACRKYPDRFIGFAGIDPWKGDAAIHELERCVRELGLKGVKFHPGRQQFYPNDTRFYPLFETASALGAPVLFHTGMMAAGAGTPGGRGVRLDYTRPIYLDHLAADFPNLTIIAAHPSWPWADEGLALARHKSNVFLDLSGYSPKYIPPQYIQFANTLLQDQMLFGSDYPFIPPERWLADFEDAGFRPQVRDKILLLNAQRMLGVS